MKKGFVLFLATLMLFTLGCGMLNSWLGLSSSAGTVSELWSDVPPLEGATKADLEIPLVFQLMIQAVAKSGVNYIAFTTPQTPAEVKSFYTAEVMQANGWQTSRWKAATPASKAAWPISPALAAMARFVSLAKGKATSKRCWPSSSPRMSSLNKRVSSTPASRAAISSYK
ncbi:MAG: hypothetical protein HC875_38070 [Anaerolineales bacterium]|nr:hypothetical protein [Anaerolineales bacterium]